LFICGKSGSGSFTGPGFIDFTVFLSTKNGPNFRFYAYKNAYLVCTEVVASLGEYGKK
jgi:hypothetical protein